MARCARRCPSEEDGKLETSPRERGARARRQAKTRGDKDGEAGVFRTINSAIVA